MSTFSAVRVVAREVKNKLLSADSLNNPAESSSIKTSLALLTVLKKPGPASYKKFTKASSKLPIPPPCSSKNSSTATPP